MSVKIIVFDFDGTLIDSNQIKNDAFFDLFPKNSKYKKIISDVLLKQSNYSRYQIIKDIYDNTKSLLKESNQSSRINDLIKKYNQITFEKVNDCQIRYDIDNQLRQLKQKYLLYLSSYTPYSILFDLVTNKNWQIYFNDIFGYPAKKKDTIEKIIKDNKTKPNQVLVVGDGLTDQDSALLTGCHYLSVNSDFKSRLPIEHEILKIEKEKIVYG